MNHGLYTYKWCIYLYFSRSLVKWWHFYPGLILASLVSRGKIETKEEYYFIFIFDRVEYKICDCIDLSSFQIVEIISESIITEWLAWRNMSFWLHIFHYQRNDN